MSRWHREWHRARSRERTIAAGGPWPCAHCGQGEVWKLNAKYCGKACRKAANVEKQRLRDKRRTKRPEPVQKKPPALVYRRAASLAECG